MISAIRIPEKEGLAQKTKLSIQNLFSFLRTVTVIVAAAIGMGLYLFPYYTPLIYLVTSISGLVLFCWAVATAGRKFSAFNEAVNDRN